MARENVEIVGRAWEAVLKEDWPGLLAVMHPAVEAHDFDIPDAGVYHGHDGVVEWLTRRNEPWASWHPEDLEITATGDGRVIATFKVVATGGSSGLEMERLDAVVYDLHDGKIARMEYFNDRRAALAAVGLSE